MSFSNLQESGRPVTIKDEGLSITTNVASIDFAGAGVTGSAIGQAVTETIPGGAAGSIDGSGSANQITYWVDGDTVGALDVATYPTLTQLSYVKGVTSAIQTQLDAKLTSSSISDTVYGAGWNADTTHAPSKNAVYDKIETISAGTTSILRTLLLMGG